MLKMYTIPQRDWYLRGFAIFAIFIVIMSIHNLMLIRSKYLHKNKVLNSTNTHTVRTQYHQTTTTAMKFNNKTTTTAANANASIEYKIAKNTLVMQLIAEQNDTGAHEIVDKIENALNFASKMPDVLTNDANKVNNIKKLTGCYDKDFKFKVIQHGEFIGFHNFIQAEHGAIGCANNVTFVTHGDFTQLKYVIPVLKRWNAPMSLAIYVGENDYVQTMKSIEFIRQCLTGSDLVRRFATFHIYFNYTHRPNDVAENILNAPINCEISPPYLKSNPLQSNHPYPINVGRNIARMAAMTHFIFVCDLDLLPSSNLSNKFIEMIARNKNDFNKRSTHPKVYALPVYDIDSKYNVPQNKTDLLKLLHLQKCMRNRNCLQRQYYPNADEWETKNETEHLNIFYTGQQIGAFSSWKPVFIGTNDEPFYDERLSLDSKKDKMPQEYAMCVLDYDFHLLNNAFLVRTVKKSDFKKRETKTANSSDEIFYKYIYPELKFIYGQRDGCKMVLV